MPAAGNLCLGLVKTKIIMSICLLPLYKTLGILLWIKISFFLSSEIMAMYFNAIVLNQ